MFQARPQRIGNKHTAAHHKASDDEQTPTATNSDVIHQKPRNQCREQVYDGIDSGDDKRGFSFKSNLLEDQRSVVTNKIDTIELGKEERGCTNSNDFAVLDNSGPPAPPFNFGLFFFVFNNVLDGKELFLGLVGIRIVIIEELEDSVSFVVAIHCQKPTRRLDNVKATEK
ncbi:hypothetical protein OGAPHI_006979 [Ogataea philodendri]|uniref:Uncharacterized protein n=1 Tax=Ogataea philodendri TaxID=1378263 RepID=A0A9P8SZ58_9ASCO|nr:uncharacterized protein OGAPHI_006979 [Ogataea philodendri]KAH3660393.1 hypothetical protein OGAPHI_006979 [Ogataea philodendri]